MVSSPRWAQALPPVGEPFPPFSARALGTLQPVRSRELVPEGLKQLIERLLIHEIDLGQHYPDGPLGERPAVIRDLLFHQPGVVQRGAAVSRRHFHQMQQDARAR